MPCLLIPSDPSSREVQKLGGGIAFSGLKTDIANTHLHSVSLLNREASHVPQELSLPTLKRLSVLLSRMGQPEVICKLKKDYT